MASALEQLTNNYNTSSPVSFYDFYNAYGRDHHKGWIDLDPYSIGARFANWISGTRSSAEKEYENYLAGYEYQRNALASAKANEETYARQDSQTQRLVQDYQKAGLNPYALLNGGNLSSGVVSSEAQKPEYKRGSRYNPKDEKKLMNTAIKVLALVMLKGLM